MTVLDDILLEIRTAGRHAFRNGDDVRRFGSDYERRLVGRSRRKRPSPPTPQ